MDGKIDVLLNWNEELFNLLIRFESSESLYRRLKKITEIKGVEIELRKNYSLFKDLFGVKIAYGFIRVQRIVLDDALSLINRFIFPKRNGKEYVLQPLSDIKFLEETARFLGLERPDHYSVEGYLMNGELVSIENNDMTVIRLKYKDKPENIFYIYKLSFMKKGNELFLVLEKNI